MNKHALVISFSFSLFAATGYGISLVQAQEQSPLKIGMEITYPPFESYDAKNNIVGADPELAAAMGNAMDRKVEFIDTKFLSLINGLNAGKYDAIISGMYVTAERQTQVLSIPYATTGSAILVVRDSEFQPQSPEDLCGKNVGLEQGNSWLPKLQKLSETYCVPNQKTAVMVSEYPSAPEATQALLSGNVQAQVEIAGAAHIISERTRGRVVISSKHLIYPETLGIFVKKGNSTTHAALMKALSLIRANGEYEAILKKYSLDPISE
ncbi:transporter substrate-binding domain-containing protein [Pseudomonas protegens]|uniref:transporter substrate-binding domain-containing protein n=1 Tax=Pseudomonas protegens TaxID=380021 RepID=UPI000366CDB6|nr:transporter substrate-binding domain-containing protein [Pseudomonas protegens]ROM29385.1 amino acid ABC transporter substrate-binding protein [Pseudomonas protegens]ROM37018.1 amino acid ABC transporter substrate-binding protein [Pseudomonas protegens]